MFIMQRVRNIGNGHPSNKKNKSENGAILLSTIIAQKLINIMLFTKKAKNNDNPVDLNFNVLPSLI